jgi:hypothetical protein
MQVDRQQILFGCVFVLLMAAIAYRVMHPFVQPRVDSLTFTGKKHTGGPIVNKAIKSEAQDLQDPVISQFVNKAKFSGKVYQDLFSIYQPVQPAVEKPQPAEQSMNETEQNISAVEKDPAAAFRKYITSYKIYGSYEGEDGKAVFLSKDKLVLVAKEGDRLDGKYVIDDIGDAHIRFFLPDLDRPVTVDRGEFDDE